MERDVEIALVSSHNHEWGKCATMNRYDGLSKNRRGIIFVNKLWDRPPILHFYPGQFSLSAGDGVHWACHYQNNTDEVLINDGTATGEMCIFAAVTYPSPWSVSEVEETVNGGELTNLFSLMHDIMGPCDNVLESQQIFEDEQNELECDAFLQTESNVLE